MSGDSPFIMESFASHHGHPVVDALTGQIRSGTQCHVLFRRLDVMPDDVWVSIRVRVGVWVGVRVIRVPDYVECPWTCMHILDMYAYLGHVYAISWT